MDLKDKRVRQVERLAKEKKTLSPTARSFVDHNGETALSRYARLSRLDKDNHEAARSFIGTVAHFLSNGFDPYHADNNGEYPFLHLLRKLPFATDDINDTYVAFLKKILKDFPPPAYNRYAPHRRLRHPIHVLFRLIKDTYDETDASLAPLSAMLKDVLRRFDTRHIDHGEYMNYIKTSIRDEYNVFFDSIIDSRTEDTRLTDEDFMVILNGLIGWRTRIRKDVLDDLDDDTLRKALSKTDAWIEGNGFLWRVATGNDTRAKRVVFSLLSKAGDRRFFLESYIMNAASCAAIDLDFLRFMLDAKTTMRSAMCLNDIVANDCEDAARLLYDYGALSKRVIRELLESADNENNTTRFLREILSRHTIVMQHSKKPATATRASNPLAALNPDLSRRLASFMLK